MKKLLLLLMAVLPGALIQAQTQAEMNEIAAKDFSAADKKLNAVYQQILKAQKDDIAFIHNLRAAQKLWVQFRDAELKMKYPDREAGYYGTIHPICRFGYLTELTEERTKTLQQWITGAKEGDECAGSIPIKSEK